MIGRRAFLAAGLLLVGCTPAAPPIEQSTEPAAPTVTAVPIAKAPTPRPRRTPTVEPIVAAPSRLRIDTLNVDAPIVEVGLDSQGDMVVPTNAETVVWYGQSAPPGLVGNAILAGHTDWSGKTGVFFRLKELNPGDPVVVVGSDGTARTFAVKTREMVDPATVAVATIFAPTPTPIVTLITCGGTFNAQTRDYSHRIVVRAALSAM